jgi:DNA-binding MurR/RpiR family transcriptional regulator
MNIFEVLRKQEFSPSESILKDAILEDGNHFISLNMEQITKEFHVSRATVYRFLEKLSLNKLSDLKVKIIHDEKEWKETNKEFDYNYPVNDGASVQKIIDNLEQDYTQTILSTKSLFDYKTLRQAANCMLKAKEIDIYTSAGNIYFADNFKFQMKEIGVSVNVPHELYEQQLYAASSDSDHFAIMISFGGRNWQVEKVCKTLKKNGTKLLIICSEQAEKLFEYSDMRLYLDPHEDHSNKISSFSTRLSLLFILDVLYTCYFECDYEENIKKKKTFYQKLSSNS